MGDFVLRPAGDCTPFNVIGDAITPLVTDTDGTGYELFDLRGPADSGPPPHSHPWDEAYYVLEGQVAVMADGRDFVAGPGTMVNIPANSLHLYKIVSPEARFLVITTPRGAATFFADVDANVGAMPESLPALIAVAQRNGLSSPLFEQ